MTAKGAARAGSSTSPSPNGNESNGKPKQWDPVIVEWEDAYETHGDFNSKAVADKYEPVIRRTCGFLIALDDKRATICMDDDRGSVGITGDDDCTNISHVPMGMVRQLIKLKE
jgi:hypothetical protein